MSDNPDPIERALELLLYAPIGIGVLLKESAPSIVETCVARGRAEIDRRQDDLRRHVTTVRSTGEVALAFGAPKLRARVERTVADAQQRAGEIFGSAASSSPARPPAAATPPTPPPAPPAPAAPTPAPRTTPSDTGWTSSQWSPPTPPAPSLAPAASASTGNGASNSAALPIPGYDALSASQVVERLIGLAPDELASVHAYEASHRQRRTILGKIEQLAG